MTVQDRIKLKNNYLVVQTEETGTAQALNLAKVQTINFGLVEQIDENTTRVSVVFYLFRTEEINFWIDSSDGYGSVSIQYDVGGFAVRTLQFTDSEAVNYLRQILS